MEEEGGRMVDMELREREGRLEELETSGCKFTLQLCRRR